MGWGIPVDLGKDPEEDGVWRDKGPQEGAVLELKYYLLAIIATLVQKQNFMYSNRAGNILLAVIITVTLYCISTTHSNIPI